MRNINIEELTQISGGDDDIHDAVTTVRNYAGYVCIQLNTDLSVLGGNTWEAGTILEGYDEDYNGIPDNFEYYWNIGYIRPPSWYSQPYCWD